jgi:iron-sulfur cluster repair protein YtfE (RIC family)
MRYQIPKQKCSGKLAAIITTITQAYTKNSTTDFLELHNTIYTAAVNTVRMSGARIKRKKLNHLQNTTQTPPWERRLKKQIDELRNNIGQVQQAQNGDTSNRLQKCTHMIKKKIHVHAKHDPSNAHTTEILDTFKQKLSAKSQWLRQYKVANERKQQNRLFTTNNKSYHGNIESE